MNYLGCFPFFFFFFLFLFSVLILCTLRTQRYCIFIVTANLETLHLSCLSSKHNIIYIYINIYKYKLLFNLCTVFIQLFSRLCTGICSEIVQCNFSMRRFCVSPYRNLKGLDPFRALFDF